MLWIRIRIRNRLFSECTANTLIIWSHTSIQNNDEGPITKLWRGSLRLFAYVHIYTYTHIHTHTHTHIYCMQCIPIDYFGPLSTARQEIPPPNPGGPESREIRRVCWSYRPEIWQATRQSCCRDARAISERLKISKARISQPRDPTKSRVGTTARPAEEGPDELRVEMSAKANLPLAQTPPPTWSYARNTISPVQFTMFHHLLPYPSGRVAAHHNRAGIVPTLVASDRRRSGTGPPRQVHRIRALVYVYYWYTCWSLFEMATLSGRHFVTLRKKY